jgi:hypothetical protein
MMGDSWQSDFPQRFPWWDNPNINTPKTVTTIPPSVSLEDFNKLRLEVEELKKLLLAAKEFDEKTGQKDCHMDEKVEFIKHVAKFVGVDLKEVFG